MAGIVLVGYRGCGKSTVAVAVAERLGWPMADADALIERRVGSSIAQIFADAGEVVFRDHEAAVVESLLAQPHNQVLATGGGVIERASNRLQLQAAQDLVIYLQAPAEELAARLAANAGDRPSLTGAPVADEVAAMLERREPWYQAVADVVINAAQPPERVVEDVVAAVENWRENAADC